MAASVPTPVGIDVGSARISVASWPPSSASGAIPTHWPCCVAQNGSQSEAWPPCLTGPEAQKRAFTQGANTAWALPRLLARGHDDAMLVFEAERLPTKRSHNDRGDALLHIGKQPMWPEEGLGQLLRDALTHHQHNSKEDITQAVITVPAQFSRAQRQALSHAARIAGLRVSQFVAAPVAAALAMAQELHAAHQPLPPLAEQAEQGPAQQAADAAPEPMTVLSVDVGAGSVDVALLRITPQNVEVLQLASANLGGDHIDDTLVQAVASDFFEAHAIDLRQHPMAHQRLRHGVQKVREALAARAASKSDDAEGLPLELPFITADTSGPKHLSATITPQAVLACSINLIQRVKELCVGLLQQASVAQSALGAVWLGGGLQQLPGLQSALASLGADVALLPADAAPRGAAVLAAVLGETLMGPTLSVTPEAKAQAVPEGDKRGLTAQELAAILQAQEEMLAEAHRLQAFKALQQRAQTMLANLAGPIRSAQSAEGEQATADDSSPGAQLQSAMAKVAQLLEVHDPSQAAHEQLHNRLQSLDIAAAQWQRGTVHA